MIGRWLTRSAGCVCILAISASAWAQEINVAIGVDRRLVQLGDAVQLSVTVNGSQQVEPPSIEVPGCVVRYRGPSSQISIVNGRMSTTVSHLYLVMPQTAGQHAIGPFTVTVDGRPYTTNALSINAVDHAAGANPSARSGSAAPQSTNNAAAKLPLQFQIGLDQTEAYVNQEIPARLQLIAGQVALRSCDMPTLEADGVLIKPIQQPRQTQIMVGGQPQRLIEFDTTIIPLRAGALRIGPATLTCQVVTQSRRRSTRRGGLFDELLGELFGEDPFASDVFTGSHMFPVTVDASAVPLQVRALPTAGRPAGMESAVGTFTLQVEAVPVAVAVGEPVTLTMTIRGEGNLDTVNAPALVGATTGFKVYPAQLHKIAEVLRDSTKVYEQVLIPTDPSIREIPSVALSFFNPNTNAYDTAMSDPIPLHVRAAAAHERTVLIDQQPLGVRSMTPEVLGRGIVYIKEQMGELYAAGHQQRVIHQWWLWWLLPGLLLSGSEWYRRRQQALRTDTGARRASGALKRAIAQTQHAHQRQRDGQVAEAYADVFKGIQQYVGDRFNLATSGLTKDDTERSLRARGVPDALIHAVETLCERCDAARFAPGTSAADALIPTIQEAERVMKQLEQWRGTR